MNPDFFLVLFFFCRIINIFFSCKENVICLMLAFCGPASTSSII